MGLKVRTPESRNDSRSRGRGSISAAAMCAAAARRSVRPSRRDISSVPSERVRSADLQERMAPGPSAALARLPRNWWSGMAGDWIKMRTDLAQDPAVIAIGDALGVGDYDTIVGKLHRLWSWATDHLVDGNAVGVTEKWVDAHVGVPGFAKAMANVRPRAWLNITKRGVEFPRWEEHLSQGAKSRALTNRRVARARAQNGNDASVTKALPEKRRVYKDPPTPPPSGGNARRGPRAEREAAERREHETRESQRRWWVRQPLAERERIAAELGWPATVNLFADVGAARIMAAQAAVAHRSAAAAAAGKVGV